MSSSQSDQGRPTRLPWIALAVIAAVAVGVVVAYFGAQRAEETQREAQQQERAARREALIPESGTACQALRAARKAFNKGDEEVLGELVKDAEQLAIEALNTTGIKFGKPERMALYLGEIEEIGSPTSRELVEQRLDVAGESCSELKKS